MKLVIGIIGTALAAFVLQMFGPWWMIGVAAFLVALVLDQKVIPSFLAGFLGVGLLWLIQAVLKDMANEGILSSQVGNLLQGLSGTALIIITALIGAIVGGLAGLLGQSTRGLS